MACTIPLVGHDEPCAPTLYFSYYFSNRLREARTQSVAGRNKITVNGPMPWSALLLIWRRPLLVWCTWNTRH